MIGVFGGFRGVCLYSKFIEYFIVFEGSGRFGGFRGVCLSFVVFGWFEEVCPYS